MSRGWISDDDLGKTIDNYLISNYLYYSISSDRTTNSHLASIICVRSNAYIDRIQVEYYNTGGVQFIFIGLC